MDSPLMTGSDVRQVQIRLSQLGYSEVGAPDGVFGPATANAVAHFQSANALDADGVVGPLTWERLFSDQATAAADQGTTPIAALDSASLTQIAVSPDGTMAWIATTTGVILFDVAEWQDVAWINEGQWIGGIAVLPATNGSEYRVAMVLVPGGIEVWNPTTRERISNLSEPEDEPLQLTAVATCLSQNENCPAEARPGRAEFTSIAASPDGRWLAAGAKDSFVRVWDVETGQEARALATLSGVVTSVAFSPDSRSIAAGAISDCAANIVIAAWEVSTGLRRPAPSGVPADVYAVTYHPDGTMLASGGVDGVLYIGNVGGGSDFALSGHSDAITAIAFSPDGRRVVSGSKDHNITVWDAQTGSVVYDLSGHADTIASLVFSPNSDRLLSASVDGDLRLWDMTTGKLLNVTLLFEQIDIPPLGC
jgi:WD40 repeat protein